MKPVLFAPTATEFTTNGIGKLSDAASCTVKEERNGAFELTLKYPVEGIHYSEIQQRSIIYAKPNPVDDPQPFRVYRISKPINGLVTVYAYHISYDLTGIPVSPYTAASVQAALAGFTTYAVVANPFTFWSDMTNSGDFAVKSPTSVRSLMGGGVGGSILDVYGGEYKYDKYTVRLYQQRGVNRGVTIRYGKNLTDLKQDENCSEVYTGVYAYYSDGESLVETSPKVTPAPGTYDYTRVLPLDLTAEFKQAPSAADLKTAAEEYIATHNIGVPKVSLNVSFVQLEQTQEYRDLALLERVELCDTVTVIFERLGVNATAQVTATLYNVLIDAYDSVTIGDIRTNVAMTIAAQAEEIAKGPDLTALQAAVIEATELITGNQGGYVVIHSSTGAEKPDEILIMDQPSIEEATQVWRWNKSGLGYSSSGYNGPYGLAMTIDGKINADFITTGGMDAARITAGILRSKNGRFLIDLTANTITMKNKSGATVFGFDGNGNLTISGTIYASAGEFTGKITANSGKIAGFDIQESSLYSRNLTIDNEGTIYFGNRGYLSHNNGLTGGGIQLKSDDSVRGTVGSRYFDFDGTQMTIIGSCSISSELKAGIPASSGGETVYWGTNTNRFVYHGSSRKYKKDITSVTAKEAQKILKLNPVTFVYKDDEEEALQHGLIAEEVYKLYPEMIGMKNGEVDSMHYEQLWAPLIKIVQMQDTRIKQLEEALKNAK